MNAKEEKVANSRWWKLAHAEEHFLHQRARVQRIRYGDSNSRYFHNLVSSWQAVNHIHYLVSDSGQRIESQKELEDHCVGFYKDLLGGDSRPLSHSDLDHISSLTPFRCSEAQKIMLQGAVTPEEVRREVFLLPKSKSPGPDGFTGEFFQKTWEITGPDFVAAIMEFFSSGRLLKQLNSTAITLIPKKIGADKIGDFRPISLCNVIFKIISKILARRLASLLPYSISNCQSAFVKGRLMIENVLLATELVQGFNRKNISRRGLLKVDLKKAFDSVNWAFILQIFRAAEFPDIYINWVKECLTTTSFSVKVNGSLCGYFKGTKGLRQGDPLSPYIFVVAMECFANLLKKHFDRRKIGLHPLCRNPKITHLAFADDLMILFDGKVSSLQGITAALQVFHRLSGLEMNKEKTSIFFAGQSTSEIAGIRGLGFKEEQMPIRYLGLPLLHRQLRKSDYSPLTDQIASKFSSWSSKCLSFSGRLQLISSVTYSLLNFWFSTFSFPKGCLREIEGMCNKFLWMGDMAKKTVAKISWKSICQPKKEGGLGLRDLSLWNKTLNLKLVWLLFSDKDSLWVAWNLEHRLKRRNFWDIVEKQGDSWVWKKLLLLRPLARSFLSCSIGDGNRASYWFDVWSPLGPLIDYVGYDGPRILGIPIYASVAQGTNISEWILPSCRTRNPSLMQLRQTLLSTQLPTTEQGRDRFLWGIENNRKSRFSAQQTWNALRETKAKKEWYKAVWFSVAVPKNAFTFWVANFDRLPVKSRLASWGIDITTTCCLCNQGDETRDHLFLHCDYSCQVWKKALSRIQRMPFTFHNWDSMISWLLSRSFNGASSILKRLAAQAIIYYLWKERNDRIHNNIATSPDGLFTQIDRSLRDSFLARRHRKGCKNLFMNWSALA